SRRVSSQSPRLRQRWTLPPRVARGHCIWPELTWPDTREFSSGLCWNLRECRLAPQSRSFNFIMTLDLLHAVTGGRSLTEEEAESAMGALLAGGSTPVLTAAFLTALRMKGETVDELTGFARAMRAASTPLPIDPAARPLLDTCGTGGGGKG